MLDNLEKLIDKAGILVEALPYIQKFYGKTIVVKYGGNAMVNEELKHSVMEDITLLKYIGMNPIVVHGGGPDISEALKTYDIKSEFVNGLRVTDKTTVEVAQMVLTGKTNKEVVAHLNRMGGNAVGLCGIDGNTIKCKKLYTQVDGKKVDIGFVGDIVEVNTHVLDLLSSDAYIPVIAPIGIDDEGQSYNINADTVASEVACALKAEKLIYLTDVSGVKDKDDNIVHVMNKESANKMIADGTISGGMIPKVTSCIGAIDKGVNSVHILNGTIPHCILLEIFTDKGIGTMITGK